MTSILKNRLKTLCCDESGVALAFSVVVFLFLYLFGMGIYAVGDTVQKRIKLQNAVDAAAYSGAVVQADTLSRIAVINKAMSWTYVMQTRMQMDYIMHKWLGNTIKTWDIMDKIVKSINAPSCCGQKVAGIHYYAGRNGGHGKIELNPYGEEDIENIRKAYDGFGSHLSDYNIQVDNNTDSEEDTAGIFDDFEEKCKQITKEHEEEIVEILEDYTKKEEETAETEDSSTTADKTENVLQQEQSTHETQNESTENETDVNKVLSGLVDEVEEIIEDNQYKKRRKKRFRKKEAVDAIHKLLKDMLGDGLSDIGDDLTNWSVGSLSSSFFSGIGGIDAAGQRLGRQIAAAKSNIQAMNNASTLLRDNLKQSVELAISNTMQQNYPESAFQSKVYSASQYMTQLKSSDERHFLDFASEFRGQEIAKAAVFNKGAGTWMNIITGNGICRGYTVDLLTASWTNFAQCWVHPWTGHFPINIVLPPSLVTAGTFRDSFYTGEAARPLVLTKKYFQPEGAIVVAASIPLSNPFASWGNVSKGLFSAFTVGGGGQKIVAVSAARAGYHNHSESGWETGEYRNHIKKPDTLPGKSYIDEAWNLCEADWDAAFIPLNDTTTILASDFKKLIESVGSRDFVPKKDSNKNTKINYQEAVKHVTH